MLTHGPHLTRPIHIQWQRPVLPDRGPANSPAESPISRRLLDVLHLAPHDRLLAIGTRDLQFLELAADAVGARGHITWIEPDVDRLHRARRRVERLRCAVTLLPELPRPTRFRFDAIALVSRDGIVPDADELRHLAGRLDAGGRLAVVAFAAPTGRIATSGIVRPSAAEASTPWRTLAGPARDLSRAHKHLVRAGRNEDTAR